jgi:hypothetical protein
MKNDVAWVIAISKVFSSVLAGLARQDLETYIRFFAPPLSIS